ncbi:MAG: hypothetical protein M3464_17090 [Chloroflexota bacterium]|nr:hypothetical protein [Chloroflexota bacterium]
MLAAGEHRRSILKKFVGGLVGIAAVDLPGRALGAPIGKTCTKQSDCEYGTECSGGKCVCPDGYEDDIRGGDLYRVPVDDDDDGGGCYQGYYYCPKIEKCIKDDECCESRGYDKQCCDGNCIDKDACCGVNDCGAHQVCTDYEFVCDDGYKDCDGTCIPDRDCRGAYDRGYDETREYGRCVAGDYVDGGGNGGNHTKTCKARCQGNCMKAGRKSGRLSGAKLRGACQARCTKKCH